MAGTHFHGDASGEKKFRKGRLSGSSNSSEAFTKRENGAGDEIRTHDSHLGKVVLYQLSYARIEKKKVNFKAS